MDWRKRFLINCVCLTDQKKKISRENHKLFKKDRNERLKKKLFSESKVEGFIGIVIFDINLKIVMRCKLKLPQIVVCSS